MKAIIFCETAVKRDTVLRTMCSSLSLNGVVLSTYLS